MNTDINNLKEALKKAHSNEDYNNSCIKYAERLTDHKLPIIFDTKHLSYLIGISATDMCKMIYKEDFFYKEREIPKKNGNVRQLHIPELNLRYIQRWILDNILFNIPISEYATGFYNKRSILTNAKYHVSKDCIINMDIKDFFPSINFNKIFKIFYYYGYTKEISYILAKLCTYKDMLPQGSPASPYLSNIICLKIDKRISSLAKKYNANYSRYADDITISGNYGINKCILIIERILKEEGFEVNHKKTRVSYKHQRQEVTGLIVNKEKVTINKEYKKELKKNIYFCKKYGVSDHMNKINCEKSFYKEHLYGKAYYIHMIEPEEGKKILKLLDEIEWDY